MREFVFALAFEPDANPVADVLAAHPDATIRSLSCHVTPESLWRVDHAAGTTAALADLEDAYQTSAYVADCLVADGCGADCEIQVLDRSSEELVVYSYWERTDACTSVPHVALETLGEGLLFETYRQGRRYRWRLVLGDDAPVGDFFERLGEAVGACAGMEVLKLTDLDPERQRTDSEVELPAPQRRALEAAVAAGYYETPRAIDLGELADRLEVPRSTLSYRLRRAEAQLATAYVGEGPFEKPLASE